MFSQELSLEQAPPIGVILRFFLTVPLFGMTLAILLLLEPDALFASNSGATLAAIHLFFLGVVAMAMVGALFQMLPVLAGVVITSPLRHSGIVHLMLVTGTVMLAAAFMTFEGWMFSAAMGLLGVAVTYVVILMLPPLLKQRDANATVKGMRVALVSLGLALLFAIVMLYGHASSSVLEEYLSLRSTHYSFALIGWVAFLIISVAFQVIEMFYVTPPYPNWLSQHGWKLFLATLLLKAFTLFFTPGLAVGVDAFLVLLLGSFAVITLRRLSQRKRPVADATVWFWRLGMGWLLVSLLIWLLSLWQLLWSETLGLLAFGAFVLSVINGMMYKIAPFLVWFHLNSQGFFDAPVMNEVISQKRAKLHFWLHAVSMVLLMLSGVTSEFMYAGALTLLLAFALLGYNLRGAIQTYGRVQKEGNRFDMTMMEKQ